jgi:hypothetical protein
MTTLSRFRRRDPWWEIDGAAARGARRRRRFVAFVAFLASLAAVAAAAVGWLIALGIAGTFGVHATLGIG